jgi:hypothetical protein
MGRAKPSCLEAFCQCFKPCKDVVNDGPSTNAHPAQSPTPQKSAKSIGQTQPSSASTRVVPLDEAIEPNAQTSVVQSSLLTTIEPTMVRQLLVSASSSHMLESVRSRCASSVVLVRPSNVSGSGSGVMIQPDLVPTNHHVLPDVTTATGGTIWLNYFDENVASEERRLLPKVFFAVNEELVLALVTCENVGSPAKHIDLPLDDNDLAVVRRDQIVGSRLLLVGHPRGGPQATSFGKNQVGWSQKSIFDQYC